MKEKNRFSKPVAFNKTNETDKLILAHIEEINFSGYVKELIFADIEKRKQKLRIVKRSANGGITYIESDNTPPPSKVSV